MPMNCPHRATPLTLPYGGTGIYTSAQGQVVADFSQKFQFDFELLP